MRDPGSPLHPPHIAARLPAVRPAAPALVREATRYFDRLPDPIFVTDHERRYVYVNRAGCRAFGAKRAAMVGRRVDEWAAPETRRELARIWAALVKRGKARSELAYRMRGGRTATFAGTHGNFLPGLHLSVLRETARPTTTRQKTTGTLRGDVDRRRAAEAAPRQPEQHYRRIFFRTITAIVVFDLRDGTVLDANRQAARIFGYRLNRFLGLSLKRTAKDPAVWNRYARSIRRRGTLINAEFLRLRPNGQEVLLSTDASLIEYRGRPAVVALLQDVTERRRMEQALRLSESRLRAVRDGSLDAFYILESVRDARGRVADFRFVDANRRGAALLSRTRRELLGRNLCELFAFARPQGVFDKFKRVVETRRANIDVFPITVPEIKAKWIHEHTVPVGDGIAITSRDISEEMESRHALQQLSWKTLEAQEAERRRVARDLHDGVGQWLTAARYRLQAADSRLRGAGTWNRRTLAGVRRELAAAKRVVAAALSEVRRISHRLRPGELDDLGFVAALRGLCRETARRTGLSIVLRGGRLRQRPSRMVEEALYRIVQEGLTNIERHAQARHVGIRLRESRGQIWLKIRDDGRGISVRRMRSSTGAGLGNMQERAALAGGSFVRRSVAGHGTEIFVQFPQPRASSRRAR